MADKRDGLDSVRLDEQAARKLIERATELDARFASQSSVADLREAAMAAGISEEAFRRALEEVRSESVAPPPGIVPPRRGRVITAAVLLVLIAALATVLGTRLRPTRVIYEPATPSTLGPDRMPIATPSPPYAVRKTPSPVARKKIEPAPTKKPATGTNPPPDSGAGGAA
jgi:hypothetical protein